MGEMRRAISREEAEGRKRDRFASTLVIAASIIAAIHLAREPDIAAPTPRVSAAIEQSVALAKRILDWIVPR